MKPSQVRWKEALSTPPPILPGGCECLGKSAGLVPPRGRHCCRERTLAPAVHSFGIPCSALSASGGSAPWESVAVKNALWLSLSSIPQIFPNHKTSCLMIFSGCDGIVALGKNCEVNKACLQRSVLGAPCLCPPQLTPGKLKARCDGVWGGVFGRGLGHEGGALEKGACPHTLSQLALPAP